MKILYVAHNHPPVGAPLENIGGMQRVSMQLLEELNRRDDIEVETAILNTAWKGIGIRVFVFLLKQLFKLPRQAKESGADVILFSSMVTASLAYFLRSKVDIPMVTINHGQDVTLPVRIYQKFLPSIFSCLDGVISVSRATRQACIDRGMEPGKGVALGNGFKMDRLKSFPDRLASREHLRDIFGIDLKHRFMLLTVGRMVRRKGHEWFIRKVFPLLGENMVYVAAGDGPELERVRQAVNESSGKGRIYLPGRLTDEELKQVYAAADLFIMPNIPVPGDMEGFGVVLLEANMAKTPAIAADLEGIKDVIANGKNGYLVPPMDGQAFAEVVQKTLQNDLEEFAEQTRIFVKQKFSWQQVAQEYLEFISAVIESDNKPGSKH